MEHLQKILDNPSDSIRSQSAGFFIRAFARLIDTMILALVLGAVFFLRGQSILEGLKTMNPLHFMLLYLFTFPLIRLVYFTLFECSKLQATPGKLAVDLKVVTDEGYKLTFFKALGRNLTKIFSFITIYIGFLMLLWNKEKQTLHDSISGTWVVNNSKA